MKLKKRRCVICRNYFVPGRYNHHKQKTCGSSLCQRKLHLENCRKYHFRAENRTPEKRRANSERVKKWQRTHPGYKRKQRERKKIGKNIARPDVLRDFAQGEKSSETSVLRDDVFQLMLMFEGFMSHYFDVLRDDIGSVKKQLYDRGRALYSDVCNANLNL